LSVRHILSFPEITLVNYQITFCTTSPQPALSPLEREEDSGKFFVRGYLWQKGSSFLAADTLVAVVAILTSVIPF
jgi:hypothetical protein